MNKKRVKRSRLFGKIMFMLYMLFLLYFLIFSDWYGREGTAEDYRYNIVLFKEIERFIRYRAELGILAVFKNLIGNIVIFIPFGFFILMASKSGGLLKTIFYSAGLSFCVELFQLFTRVGSFDVDDIFLNTLGGALGYLLFLVCRTRRRYNESSKRR